MNVCVCVCVCECECVCVCVLVFGPYGDLSLWGPNAVYPVRIFSVPHKDLYYCTLWGDKCVYPYENVLISILRRMWPYVDLHTNTLRGNTLNTQILVRMLPYEVLHTCALKEFTHNSLCGCQPRWSFTENFALHLCLCKNEALRGLAHRYLERIDTHLQVPVTMRLRIVLNTRALRGITQNFHVLVQIQSNVGYFYPMLGECGLMRFCPHQELHTTFRSLWGCGLIWFCTQGPQENLHTN